MSVCDEQIVVQGYWLLVFVLPMVVLPMVVQARTLSKRNMYVL